VPEPLTIMAVHAHPDDEAIGTGGVLARYAREGMTTVLVTCTNGEFGDAPGGVKPDDDGHDTAAVVEVRRRELQAACDALGIGRLELLGYHDSGMMGWPQNDLPHAFWNTPVDEAAKRVASLMEQYRPQVVVTYDDNGFYGHPDHIQTHRVTMRAAEMTGIPRKIYETAVGKKALGQMFKAMQELGIDTGDDGPTFDPEDPPFGIPDEQITTVVDVSAYVDAKREAIAAHASQTDSTMFMKLPPDVFRAAFSRESFVRRVDDTGSPVPEDDLFAGLR
jgi:N-acetyl-1-D-myo-inositol-2-amino-2-deoxy-alpha-D-glucopyranoside deacetylase